MNKYRFSTETETQLKAFEIYLRKQKYAIDTIRQISNYAGVYLQWLEAEGLDEKQVKYNEFTDFIFHIKKDK